MITRRFRVASASVFAVSLLILLAGMIFLPDNSVMQERSTLHRIVIDALPVMIRVAIPVCLASAAVWVIAILLDARHEAGSDSILDWRLE